MRAFLLIAAVLGVLFAAPATIDSSRAKRFWSFRPIDVKPVPTVRDAAWGASPIDRFVLRKLEDQNLKPAPPADRATWLRRVTMDLVRETMAAVLAESPGTPAKQKAARIFDTLIATERFIDFLTLPAYDQLD